MAIAYDTQGHNNGGGGSISFNLSASASNEVAIIFLSYDNSLGATFGSLTVGGSSTGITQIGSEVTIKTNRKARAYYLVNPPTSSSSYAFSVSGTGNGVILSALLYSGVDTSSPIDSSNMPLTGSGTSATLSTTVVASNCWLASHIETSAGSVSASTGTTERYNIASVGFEKGGDSNGTVGTGSQSMAWTFSSGSYGAMIVSFQPVASIDYPLTATVQSYILTGIASLFTQQLNLITSVQTYTLSGISALFSKGKILIADLQTYTLSGIDSIMLKALNLISTAQTYTLTGINNILYSSRMMIADLQTYTLSGISAIMYSARTLTATVQTYVLTGVSSLFSKGFNLVAGIGSFVVSTFSVKFPIYWRNISKNVISIVNKIKNVVSITNIDKTNL